MSKKIKKILSNVEAKMKVSTVVAITIVVTLSTMFVMLPQDSIVKADPGDIFDNSITLSIDHTQVDSNLVNFPVLVSNSSCTILDGLDSNDFSFYSGNTELNWELDEWDDATDTLIAWVNVTAVSSSSDTTFKLWYDDTSVGSDGGENNATDTWDGDYLMVLHMNEISGTLNDSTSNSNDAPVDSSDTTEAEDYGQTGIVGDCVAPDGGGDVDNGENWDMVQPFQTYDAWNNGSSTIEVWLNFTDLTHDYHYPIKIASNGEPDMFIRHMNSSGNAVLQAGILKPSIIYANVTTSTIGVSQWYYFTLRHNDSQANELCALLNGTLVSSADIDDMYYSTATEDRNNIGADKWDKYGMDNSLLDEFRISKIARSDAWLKATYNSFVNPTTFITFGDAEDSSSSSFSLSGGAGASNNITWSTEEDSVVWSNATDWNAGAQLEIITHINSTDNCTDIFIDFDNQDFNSQLYAENISIEVNVANGSGWTGNTHNIPANNNITLNDAMWAGANWCHGASPFPMEGAGWTNTTIYVRFKLTVKAGVPADTYTASGWDIVWKVST